MSQLNLLYGSELIWASTFILVFFKCRAGILFFNHNNCKIFKVNYKNGTINNWLLFFVAPEVDLLSKDPCKQGFLLQWWKSQDIVDVVELSEIFLSDLIINQRKSSVTESHGLGSFCLHVKATGQAEKTDIFCERKEK